MLDDSPRSTRVIAVSDCNLLLIEKEQFDSITEDLPEVMRAVALTVVGRLREEWRLNQVKETEPRP